MEDGHKCSAYTPSHVLGYASVARSKTERAEMTEFRRKKEKGKREPDSSGGKKNFFSKRWFRSTDLRVEELRRASAAVTLASEDVEQRGGNFHYYHRVEVRVITASLKTCTLPESVMVFWVFSISYSQAE